MSKKLCLLLALTLAFSAPAFAKTTKKAKSETSTSSDGPDLGSPTDMTGRFGAGAMAFAPVSVNAKYWITPQIAVEGGLGFGFIGLGGFEPFADCLYNFGPVFGHSNEFVS